MKKIIDNCKTIHIYGLKFLKHMFKKHLALTFAIFVFFIASIYYFTPSSKSAESAILGFAKSLGGSGSDEAYSLKLDSSGNIYIAGHFSGTVDFDPGAGTTNLVSNGGTDAFFAKYNSSGDFVWVKGIGGTGSDRILKIVFDSSNNIYTTGFFSSTVDFDPGAGTTNLVSNGTNDIFFAKYDSNGDFVWAKGMGDTSADIGNGLILDSLNNVYIVGQFNGTVDFDPGVGVTSLVSNGGQDIFFAKYDSSGDFVWAKNIGGTSTDAGNGLALDSLNNVYITGQFNGTVDFDPGAGTTNLVSNGGTDIFFAKYDSNGDFVLAKNIGGTSTDAGEKIILDSSNNQYITGRFSSTVDFDPGAGTTNLVSAGSTDIFFAKYDSSGDFVWAKGVGGTLADTGNDLMRDSSNNIYITGTFNGTVDFDPGAGTTSFTSSGSLDLFFAKYDSVGDFLYAQGFGDTTSDSSNSIHVDTSGNLYATGRFRGTVDFDPSAGTTNLVSAGVEDIFFAKYIFDSTAPVVTASPAGNVYNSAQSVTLSANETADIYYTTDGTEPTISSTLYTTPVIMTPVSYLKFFGKDTAGNESSVVTEKYSLPSGSGPSSGGPAPDLVPPVVEVEEKIVSPSELEVVIPSVTEESVVKVEEKVEEIVVEKSIPEEVVIVPKIEPVILVEEFPPSPSNVQTELSLSPLEVLVQPESLDTEIQPVLLVEETQTFTQILGDFIQAPSLFLPSFDSLNPDLIIQEPLLEIIINETKESINNFTSAIVEEFKNITNSVTDFFQNFFN